MRKDGETVAREKESYRDNIELLHTLYPGAGMLTREQAMDVTQIKTYDTLKKHLGAKFKPDGRISIPDLARYMSR